MSTGVPPTASDHPATGKYDFPLYHPADVAAWRAWLTHHHGTARGVWVVTWRRTTGRPMVAYEHLVEEALCFGWIDSTARPLDDDRRQQLVTPRKPKSSWSRLNRRRVAELEASGRMTDAGRRAVEAARANGYWLLSDAVEDLVEPPELAAALDRSPAARRTWDGFAPSVRKPLLWWVVSAAKPETRATRIERIVQAAEQGRSALG